MRPLTPEFTFSGFTFPRYLAVLPECSLPYRLNMFKQRTPRQTGGYYHAPTPNAHDSIGIYLASDSGSSISLRWQWCDRVDGARINHTGWHADKYGDGEDIRGIVFRLPNDRGFLRGWSMGENMATSIDVSHVYLSESEAAYGADSFAENAAENEREHQERESALIEAEQTATEETESAYWNSRDVITHV